MRKCFHKLKEPHDPEDAEDDRFGAIVMPQKTILYTKGEEIALPTLGYVLFSKTQIGCETISHEAVHMATNYFRHIGMWMELDAEGCDDNEETLAYAVGNCANQVVRGLYKHKIY